MKGAKRVELPPEYNYVEIYLTLRCNLGCSYCINKNGVLKRERKEMSAEQWVNAFNKIDFGETPITLGGGEPTRHKGFYEILEGLNLDTKVDLLTNLQFDVDEFMNRINPKRFNNDDRNPAYRPIRVSYHAEKMEAEDLVKKVKKLQDAGFKIGVFGLNHPENVEANMLMSELARQEQIYFFIKDFLGNYDGKLFGHYRYPEALEGKPKKVSCRTKELLAAPDGQIYKCHRDLYAEDSPIAHISDDTFQPKYKFRACNKYGQCNPCDIKLKTNRFLKMGNCQVEIIPQ